MNYAFDLFQTSFIGRGNIGQQLKNTMTNLEANDFDAAKFQLKSIIEENELGDLNMSVGTVKNPDSDDELHELRKFLKLAADCNPNIIEFLYVEKGIIIETPIWKKIRENRELFLNETAKVSFLHYAIAQLKKIQTHRGYLLNPKDRPLRKDFNLPEQTVIPAVSLKAILSLKTEWIQSDLRETVINERKYHLALKDYKAYEKWKTERNEKRRKLEAICGYDAKHAMHLVRLVRMAKEILNTGKVNVHRHNIDADELRAIRNCEMSYEKLMETTNEIFELNKLCKKTNLPKNANYDKISDLYKEICEEHYGIKFINS